jgi:hypothetical protein
MVQDVPYDNPEGLQLFFMRRKLGSVVHSWWIPRNSRLFPGTQRPIRCGFPYGCRISAVEFETLEDNIAGVTLNRPDRLIAALPGRN